MFRYRGKVFVFFRLDVDCSVTAGRKLIVLLPRKAFIATEPKKFTVRTYIVSLVEYFTAVKGRSCTRISTAGKVFTVTAERYLRLESVKEICKSKLLKELLKRSNSRRRRENFFDLWVRKFLGRAPGAPR